MQYKDYYAILGVPRDATAEQIKRAYRKLARKYHPDVSKEQDAERRFKEVNEANEVLKDPDKRAAYDALGDDWRQGQEFRPPPGARGGFGGGGESFSAEDLERFSDFFSSLFGKGARHERAPGRPSGMDQTVRIQISLEDAYRGVTRQLRLETPELDRDGQLRARGRTLNVRIPAGVVQGQQIRLAGQAGGRGGDLFLDIDVAPHPLYRVEGKDIHLTLPVTPWEAALGATVSVPTLGGPVSLRIPAQAQSNQRLRLKGRGLPGNTPGDAFVRIEIVNPPATRDEERAAFRQLAERFASFNPRAKLGV